MKKQTNLQAVSGSGVFHADDVKSFDNEPMPERYVDENDSIQNIN